MSRSHVLERPPHGGIRKAYGQENSQFVDLYPSRTSSSTMVAAIHGGYWRSAHDLKHLSHLCACLAESGVTTASIEYRRLGEAGGGWPGTLTDIQEAVDSLSGLAPGGAIPHLVLLGHSAGGQLALWAASHATVPGALRRPTPRVRGVVALAPVSDLLEASRLSLSDGVVRQFLGGTPEEVPKRYQDASPLERLPLGVPTVLVHGTADSDVPYSLSSAYVERARLAGDDTRLVTLQDADHFDVIDPESRFWPQVLGAIQSLL
jgi:acetyl esterase/lipase